MLWFQSIKHFSYLHADDLYLNSKCVQAYSSSFCGCKICEQNEMKYRDFLQQFSDDVFLNDQSLYCSGSILQAQNSNES